MPMMRFGLTEDAVVRTHSDNAVKFLWAGSGGRSISSVGLSTTPDGDLEIPVGSTLLMMGTTSELEGELRGLKGTGVDAFVVHAAQGDAVITRVAARKWTAEGGGVGAPHHLTVIGLHGGAGATAFGGPWRAILTQSLLSRRVYFDDLITELPTIKKEF